MQTFDISGRYGDAAVLDELRGKYGGRTVDYRFELLDRYNRRKSDLTGVVSGSVAHDAGADVKRTASFVLRDGYDQVDYLSDRIRPWIRLLMPDGLWVEWPQGVFLLSTPTRSLAPDRSILRTVDAYDQGVILSGDGVDDRYSIPAGQQFTAAIGAVIANLGLTTRITPSTLTLPVTWDYEAGTSRLTIVNDLLSAMNYRSVWFDENGIMVCEPYLLPDLRPIGYLYATDAGSVITGQVDQSLDLFSIPNKWVLVVSDTDRGSFSSTFINTDPASPTSTASRGRTILAFDSGQSAADQATLDGLVRRRAYDDSQLFETVTFTTAVMPFHTNADILGITINDLGLGSVKFEELSWSIDLRVGGVMSHQVRRTISTNGGA